MLQRLKNIYHLQQAILANFFYGSPGGKIKVIGVTGTDGKTTTASLIYHILQTAGLKCALLTTVSALVDGKSYDTGFHVTTPNSFSLQKYLKKAVRAKAEYFILETTSHALDQNRVSGIPFQIGVLTNITHEHFDYHKTYQKYALAKIKLLQKAKISIINKDDSSYQLVTENLKKNKYKGKVITYGLDKTARINPKNFYFTTKLLGKFNQYNCLAAIAALKSININDQFIRQGLLTFKPPPGRQEIVYDKDFRVMVDFAHTPNSFLQILPVVKSMTKGRLIHVFGAAGLRDSGKRSAMGEASAAYSDIIILTSEDPRGEPIEKINREIIKGIKRVKNVKGKSCLEIPDRKQAIENAISLARRFDTVIITGKSHEKSMNYTGQREEPWDEFKAVNEALGNKK